MANVRRFALTIAASAALMTAPQAISTRDDAEVQLQLASLLFEETRFAEALDAYRLAIESPDSALALQARIGFVRTALRIGRFQDAQHEGAAALAHENVKSHIEGKVLRKAIVVPQRLVNLVVG